MKKSIQGLIEKLGQSPDGKLTGGFANLKGGASNLNDVVNGLSQSCSNTLYCDEPNADCSNSGYCTGDNTHSCSNSGYCHSK